jgi:hypothetical protein
MQDTIGIILNGVEPWYIKYFLPAVLYLIIGIVSFFLSQIGIRHIDKRRSREKYLGYLRVIRADIKRNLDLFCQLHAYLYVRAVPTFQLTLFVGGEIFSGISTICLNYDLLDEIFYRYFDYRHIQNRLDRILEISNELNEIRSQSSINQDQKHRTERELESQMGGTLMLIEGNIKYSFNSYNQITAEISLRDKKSRLVELSNNYLKDKFEKFQTSPDVLAAVKYAEGQGRIIDLSKRPRFYEK